MIIEEGKIGRASLCRLQSVEKVYPSAFQNFTH